MRTIERSTALEKDFRRLQEDPRHGPGLHALIADIIGRLAQDLPLPPANRDHPLGGPWRGYRDCHLKPDIVLIYGKPDATTLRLARLGAHSDLFG